MACAGRCGNYEGRPDFCKKYPTIHDFIPSGCTYHFDGGERQGSCQPEICQENNCCSWPREKGEPEGKSLDDKAGGLPCKHLVWVDTDDTEKTAQDDGADSITGDIYDALMPAIRGTDVL